jgi:hypothetical protein
MILDTYLEQRTQISTLTCLHLGMHLITIIHRLLRVFYKPQVKGPHNTFKVIHDCSILFYGYGYYEIYYILSIR